MRDLEPHSSRARDKGHQVELGHGKHLQQRRQGYAGEHREPDQVRGQQDDASVPAVGIDAHNKSEEQEGNKLQSADHAKLKG